MRLRYFLFSLVLCIFTSIRAYCGVTLLPLCENDLKTTDFRFVGQLINMNSGVVGSAVAIGNGKFIVTAKHCVTHNGKLDGMLLDGSNFVYIQGEKYVTINKFWSNEACDIAIGLLNDAVPHTVRIANDQIPEGATFYGAGFGKSCSILNDKKLDFDIDYGTLRVFKNTIKGHFEDVQFHIFRSLHLSQVYYFNLRFPGSQFGEPIQGEGMPGPGDSGGGLFVNNNGKIELFAIISAIKVDAPFYGYATDLFSQKKWIQILVGDSFSCENEVSIVANARYLNLMSQTFEQFAISDRKRLQIKTA